MVYGELGPHDFNAEWTVDREATETEDGERSRHCARCSERTDITVIPKTEKPSVTEFPDVKDTNWFYEAVNYVVGRGLFNGMNGKFEPNTVMSRGMLVTVLWRMEGEPKATKSAGFTDLKQSWYIEAVNWAAENGIVNGTSATTFSPAAGITREQMAKMFMGYSQYKKYDTSRTANLSSYTDNSKLSSWAVSPMSWAVAEGLITGVGTELQPKGSATRAQVATILKRFCEKYD